jgi:hypothetical protein
MKTINFYEWISRCCYILNKDVKYGVILIEDINWYSSWNDGLSPSEAVEEFKKVYSDGYPKEIEDKYL